MRMPMQCISKHLHDVGLELRPRGGELATEAALKVAHPLLPGLFNELDQSLLLLVDQESVHVAMPFVATIRRTGVPKLL